MSGIKRYFHVIGVMFAFAWLAFTNEQIRRWRIYFLIVALAQLPWAIYELLKLVPIRESFAASIPGLVPIDIVAGTFGANLYGGGASAEMATYLIMVMAFLLARFSTNILTFKKILLLLPIVMVPLFIGETKVVVLLFPLMYWCFIASNY